MVNKKPGKYDPIPLVPAPGHKLPKELKGISLSWQFFNNDYGTRLLEANAGNRNISPDSVRKYYRDMVEGRWETNGDTVRIDRDHNLLDGQQRATAARRLTDASLGSWTLEVAGLNPKVRSTIDVGRPRSFADELKFAGEDSTMLMAAIIKRGYLWEVVGERYDVFRLSASHQAMMDYFTGDGDQRPDNREMIRWATREGNNAQKDLKGIMTMSTYAFMLYLTATLIDKDKAIEFWIDGVRHTHEIPRSHPAQRLRKRQKEVWNDDDYIGRTRHVDRPASLANCIQAWNEFITEEWQNSTTIKIPSGGWTRDNMPDLLPVDNRGYPLSEIALPDNGWEPQRDFLEGDDEGWD